MHFILRRISGQGAEMTKVLGKSYTLVTIDKSPTQFLEDFKRLFDREYISNSDDANVFALISNEGGTWIQPLYFNQQNYIMTSDGSTFSKLDYSPSPMTEKP